MISVPYILIALKDSGSGGSLFPKGPMVIFENAIVGTARLSRS